MNSISTITHSPLTPSDITRLPASAVTTIPEQQTLPQDVFETKPKKSSWLKKTIITLVVVGALAVGAKHFAGDWLKVQANNPKWYDCIKKGITKLADWIEVPFIAAKNLFTKKAA